MLWDWKAKHTRREETEISEGTEGNYSECFQYRGYKEQRGKLSGNKNPPVSSDEVAQYRQFVHLLKAFGQQRDSSRTKRPSWVEMLHIVWISFLSNTQTETQEHRKQRVGGLIRCKGLLQVLWIDFSPRKSQQLFPHVVFIWWKVSFFFSLPPVVSSGHRFNICSSDCSFPKDAY